MASPVGGTEMILPCAHCGHTFYAHREGGTQGCLDCPRRSRCHDFKAKEAAMYDSKQCPACAGEGRVRHEVSSDMARDAGDMQLEGSWLSETCRACDGTGAMPNDGTRI